MKTKTYVFTYVEILALRDALIEKHQIDKLYTPISPIAIGMQKATKTLKDQFKEDAMKF